MKERPILFSGPMVRAIQEGRKTMTRRVVKPQPKLIESSGRWYWEKALDVHGRPLVDASRFWWEYYGTSPYGQPGDRLWVRETWRDSYNAVAAEAAGPVIGSSFIGPAYEYAADYSDRGTGWHPSIFMPRRASRITLEIVSVCVERVQDISDGDAEREGVDTTNASITGYCRERFRKLWDFINAKRGYGWDVNPWVWVVEFKRVTP